MSFMSPLQRAVYERLSSISGMPDVHDYVPQESDAGSQTPFPYVVIGADTHSPFDTDDASGAESTIVIHSWSRQPTQEEVKAVMDQVYTALHRFDLDVDGYHTVTVDFEYAESFLDQDAKTFHGVQRFRIFMHED